MILPVFAALLAQIPAEVRVNSELAAGGRGREILSPAVPRNAWSKFQLTIAAPALTEFKLWVGQNPGNAVRVEVFRDGRRMDLPYSSVIPPGVKSLTLAMNLWVDRDAPVQRIKIEPEVWVDQRWVVYPMEIRIAKATVPDEASRTASWRECFCGRKSGGASVTIAQDLRLAETRPPLEVRAAFERALGRRLRQWCADRKEPTDPEWYLRFRDWLLH